jgi:MFS family permease
MSSRNQPSNDNQAEVLVMSTERPEPISVQQGSDSASSQTPPPPVQAPAPVISLSAAAGYILAGVMITLTQGLGQNFLSSNLQQISGPMGLTQQEATWLMAAYYFPNASLTLILFKMRTQFGLRNFAEAAIVVYVLVGFAHFWIDSYQSSLMLRFFAGAAAAPMTSIGFLYILEKLPPSMKMDVGLCTALTVSAFPTALTGLLSPSLLEIDDYHSLYVAELGLAMISLGLVYLLPLTSPPRAKVISPFDVISYIFLAIALGCFAAVATVGRLYWWTAVEWLGWVTVIGIVAGTIFTIIELNRKNHLVDIRWLTSREILHFAGVLLVFRMVLSEQSSGAINLLRNVGMLNEQMAGLYGFMLLGALVGGIVCGIMMRLGYQSAIHAIALTMIAIASYLDSQATVLTRPEQMYVSQFMMSAASGLFLPAAIATGFGNAMKRGLTYILSFLVVFLATQKVGGFLGSAIYGTFVQWREQFHSARLVERLTSVDPQVAARLKQLGGAYGKVLTDPAQQAAQGAALLSRQVQQQAYALAYNDAFMLTACLAVLALAALLFHLALQRALESPLGTTAA